MLHGVRMPSFMRESQKLLFWAGGLSIAASVVHGALVSSHADEWWLYGTFFMLASAAQGIYGFAILGSHMVNGSPISERWPLRYRRAFYLAGMVGNALLVGMYVLSRTVGVPLGPEAGEVEGWDVLGVLTKAMELAVIATLAVLLGGTRARRAAAGAVSG